MTVSQILKPLDRTDFDPSNAEHRKIFLEFKRTGRWSMRFAAVWPFTTVEQSVLVSLAFYACKKENR